MRNPINIDFAQSWAIVREIGEKLRASFGAEPPASAKLQTQIDKLREAESQSPSIVPDAEHGDKHRH